MRSSKSISLKGLFVASYELYKANFRLFVILSSITGGLSFLSGLFNIWTAGIENTLIQAGMVLPTLLIGIAVIYISARAIIGFMLAVRFRLKKHRTALKECLGLSKPLVWKYLGAQFTIAAVIFIPMMLFIITRTYVDSFAAKALLMVISVLLMAFFHTKYGFLPYVRVFEPNAKKPFEYSKELVEGNFAKSVLILAMPMLVGILFMLLNPIVTGGGDSVTARIAFEVIKMIIYTLSWPFTLGVTIIAFFRLEKSVNKDKYVWTNRKFGNLPEAESYSMMAKLTEVWDIGKDMRWHPLRETKVITTDYMISDLDIKAVENRVWEKYPDEIYILTDNDDISGKCIPAFNLELKHTGHNKFFFNKSLEWIIYISEEGHIVFGGMDLIRNIKELNKARLL